MNLYRLPKKRTGLLLFLTLLALVTGLTCGMLFATQYTAYKLGYHQALGPPVLGRLYNPVNFIKWHFTFGQTGQFSHVFRNGFYILLSTFTAVTAIVWIIVVVLRFREKETDVHGSANWATEDEIKKGGLFGKKDGIYLGAYQHKNKLNYLRLADLKNVLLFAPSQSGKGVSGVVPNLLSWPHSVLVYDPKGENWMKTAGWRKEELGSETLKLDFTSNDGSSAKFNPLWEVRVGIHEVRDVQNIAGMVVNPDGRGLYDHWVKSAYNLLVGLILHVIYAERDKTLRGVADLITDPDRSIEDTFEYMLSAPHDPELERGWINSLSGQATSTHPTVSSVAREMLNKAIEERSGIISTALSFLGIYRDPIIAENTSVSDFRISDLVNFDKPVSLYIVVPESDRDRLRPLVRLILKLISSRLLEKMEFDDTGRTKFNNRLMIVLDEFARLRHLEFIEEDMAISLGYGINFFIIVQDISQIYKAYSKEEGITGNCHVRIAYAPNKVETAKELSAMAGVRTVTKYAKSFSGSFLNLSLRNISEGSHESPRPLVTPDEILRMPDDDALIFVGNFPPIYGKKIRYFLDPEFLRRSQIKPPALTGKIAIDYSSLGFPGTPLSSVPDKVITKYSLEVVEENKPKNIEDVF